MQGIFTHISAVCLMVNVGKYNIPYMDCLGYIYIYPVNPTFITPTGYMGVTIGTNPPIQKFGGSSLWDVLFLLVGLEWKMFLAQTLDLPGKLTYPLKNDGWKIHFLSKYYM